MSRLSLDFASAQRTLTRPKPYLSFGLLLTGVIVLAIVAWMNEQQVEANTALRTQRDNLAARLQRQQPQEQVPEALSAQFDQAATAYVQITTAWGDLFHALEMSRSEEIALLSLTADTAKQEFALSGEAKDFGALSKFSDTLSSSSLFRRVALSNHRLSEGAPPIVVKFDLMLAWHLDNQARH